MCVCAFGIESFNFFFLYFFPLVLGWNEKRRIHKQMINDVASREMNTQNEARVERKTKSEQKKYNTTATKRIMVPDARARSERGKYCSFTDAIAQNGGFFCVCLRRAHFLSLRYSLFVSYHHCER